MELTEKEIEEGNKIIAEYMGYTIAKPFKGFFKDASVWYNPDLDNPLHKLFNGNQSYTKPQFNTNWNWFIPAWAKASEQSIPMQNENGFNEHLSDALIGVELAIKKADCQKAFKHLVELIKLLTP